MKSIIALLILVQLLAIDIYSQKLLGLDDILSIALKESYSIKAANYSLDGSQKNLEAMKLGLRTSVDMEFDVPSYSKNLESWYNPLTQKKEFYEAGNTTFEGRLTLSQPIVFTNGQLSIIGKLFGRNQFSALNNSSKDFFSNLVFNIRQPLFAYNNLSASLEKAELNFEMSKRNYTRSEADLIYNATSAFYNLFKAKKNFEIVEERVRQSELSYETAMNKFKAGLIAEVEALQLEVDLSSARNDLLSAERSYKEANDNLKILIGLESNENIDVAPELAYNPVIINEEEAISYALKNRPDLFNNETSIRLSQMQIEEIDAKRSIKAELNLNYGINKVDTLFNNVFNNFLQNRSIVFTVSLPIWDWGQNKREVESAEANLKLSKLNYLNQKENIIIEIKQLVNRIESAKSRVEVLSKSVVVAEKSYNISLERFKSGNITSFDLSQMQLRLTDAKTNNLNALIDYKLTLADLERKTLHKF